MSAQAILILTVLTFVVGGVVSHIIGYARGRAEREGKQGRFVAIKGGTP